MPAPLSPTAATRLARAGLVVLVAWLFRETLLGDGYFYRRDILLVWYPQVESFVRSVGGGAWPLWNPSLGFGQPLLADPSAQVLYPLTWLNVLMRPWHYYTVYVTLHAVLAALGLFGLARHFGISGAGSLVAAALWTLCGPYLSFMDLWHHFAGASWLPVVVLAADRAMATRRRPDVLTWALAETGQILAGSADMCALTLLFVAGLAVYRHVAFRPLLGSANRGLLACAATAVLLALGLTAGLWLPALDSVSRAARADLPSSVRTYWSVHPAVLLELVVPGLWNALPLSPSVRAALFESREPLLGSLYVGGASLGLVAAALTMSRHPLRPLIVLTGGVAVVVALGSHTALYDVATFLIPPLRILRFPVKVMVLVGFCWSLLAGMGFDAWRDRPDRRRWVLGVIVPLALLSLFDLTVALGLPAAAERVAALLLTLPDGMSAAQALLPTRGRLLIAAALVTVGTSLAALRLRRPEASTAMAAAAAALALGDLAAYHRHPNRVGPLALVTHRPEILKAMGGGSARLYVYDYGTPGPSARGVQAYSLARQPDGWDVEAAFALAMQMYLAPESAGRWGLRGSYELDYRGLYPATLDAGVRLLRAAEETPQHLRLLRIGAVTHVVTLHAKGFEDLRLDAQLPGLFKEPIRVLAVPDPLSRVYSVGGWHVVPEAEALGFAAASGMDLRRELALSQGGAQEAPEDFTGEARIVAERPDRVRIDARLSRPGCVVLVDAFDPGWVATVDGRPQPVLRANGLFRAVKVEAGEHEIEFTYRPRSVKLGLAIALVTALGMAAIAARGDRRWWS